MGIFDPCREIIITKLLYEETTISLNIFYSKENDWVWHKTRQNPLQTIIQTVQHGPSYSVILSSMWRHTWYSFRALDCWSTGRVIDPAPWA